VTKKQALKHVEDLLAAAQKEEDYWSKQVIHLQTALWGLNFPNSMEAVEEKQFIEVLAKQEWDGE
jgi:hypothetical protein